MSVTYLFRKIKGFYGVFMLISIISTMWHLSYIYDEFNDSGGIVFIDNYNGGGMKETTEVFASKSGKKYYYPWCGGLNRVKEENRITFFSKEEAEATGLEKAKNCQGR